MDLTFTTKGNVRVVVYDQRLHAMALSYGIRKANRVQLLAKGYAPVRSGNLKRSIRVDRRRLAGDLQVYRVVANTPYAAAVHEGSGPVIYPEGEFLWVPRMKYGRRRMKRASVRGIMGTSITPYLENALETEMRGNVFGVRIRP